MEEIEYLEEYEDLILPTIQSNSREVDGFQSSQSSNMMQDEDSSSIDQDIFESLFDDHSDDESSNVLQKKADPKLSQRGSQDRTSLDSLDLLVKDLVGEQNSQKKAQSSKINTTKTPNSINKGTAQLQRKMSNTSTPQSAIAGRPMQKAAASSSSSLLKGRQSSSNLTKPSITRTSLPLNKRPPGTGSSSDTTAVGGSSKSKVSLMQISRTDTSNKLEKSKSVATVRPTMQQKHLQQQPKRIVSSSNIINRNQPSTSRQSTGGLVTLTARKQFSAAAARGGAASTRGGSVATRGGSVAMRGVAPKRGGPATRGGSVPTKYVQRPPTTIVKPERRVTKDPSEDPLSLDDIAEALLDSDTDSFSLSDISDESLDSMSELNEEDQTRNIIDVSNDSSINGKGQHRDLENIRRITPSPTVSEVDKDEDISSPQSQSKLNPSKLEEVKQENKSTIKQTNKPKPSVASLLCDDKPTVHKKPVTEKVTIISDTLLTRVDSALLDTARMDKMQSSENQYTNQANEAVVAALERQLMPFLKKKDSTGPLEEDITTTVTEPADEGVQQVLDELTEAVSDIDNKSAKEEADKQIENEDVQNADEIVEEPVTTETENYISNAYEADQSMQDDDNIQSEQAAEADDSIININDSADDNMESSLVEEQFGDEFNNQMDNEVAMEVEVETNENTDTENHVKFDGEPDDDINAVVELPGSTENLDGDSEGFVEDEASENIEEIIENTEKPEHIEETNEHIEEINEQFEETNEIVEVTNDTIERTNEHMEETTVNVSETHENVEESNEKIEETNVKEANENVADTNINFDKTNENVKEANENVEEANENVEETNVNVEEANENVEEANENVEEANENVEEANKNVEQANENVEEANEKVEEVNENVEVANENVEANENIEEANENIPEIIENIEETNKNSVEKNENVKASELITETTENAEAEKEHTEVVTPKVNKNDEKKLLFTKRSARKRCSESSSSDTTVSTQSSGPIKKAFKEPRNIRNSPKQKEDVLTAADSTILRKRNISSPIFVEQTQDDLLLPPTKKFKMAIKSKSGRLRNLDDSDKTTDTSESEFETPYSSPRTSSRASTRTPTRKMGVNNKNNESDDSHNSSTASSKKPQIKVVDCVKNDQKQSKSRSVTPSKQDKQSDISKSLIKEELQKKMDHVASSKITTQNVEKNDKNISKPQKQTKESSIKSVAGALKINLPIEKTTEVHDKETKPIAATVSDEKQTKTSIAPKLEKRPSKIKINRLPGKINREITEETISKESCKETSKIFTRENSKESLKATSQKDLTKESSKELKKETPMKTSKAIPKEISKASNKETCKINSNETSNETPEESFKGPRVKTSTNPSIETPDTHKVSSTEMSVEIIKKAGSSKEISKQTARSVVVEIPKVTPKKFPPKTPKDISNDVSKETPKESLKETPKDTSKDYSTEAIKETPRRNVRETAKTISKETLKKTPTEVPKDAKKEISEKTSVGTRIDAANFNLKEAEEISKESVTEIEKQASSHGTNKGNSKEEKGKQQPSNKNDTTTKVKLKRFTSNTEDEHGNNEIIRKQIEQKSDEKNKNRESIFKPTKLSVDTKQGEKNEIIEKDVEDKTKVEIKVVMGKTAVGKKIVDNKPSVGKKLAENKPVVGEKVVEKKEVEKKEVEKNVADKKEVEKKVVEKKVVENKSADETTLVENKAVDEKKVVESKSVIRKKVVDNKPTVADQVDVKKTPKTNDLVDKEQSTNDVRNVKVTPTETTKDAEGVQVTPAKKTVNPQNCNKKEPTSKSLPVVKKPITETLKKIEHITKNAAHISRNAAAQTSKKPAQTDNQNKKDILTAKAEEKQAVDKLKENSAEQKNSEIKVNKESATSQVTDESKKIISSRKSLRCKPSDDDNFKSTDVQNSEKDHNKQHLTGNGREDIIAKGSKCDNQPLLRDTTTEKLPNNAKEQNRSGSSTSQSKSVENTGETSQISTTFEQTKEVLLITETNQLIKAESINQKEESNPQLKEVASKTSSKKKEENSEKTPKTDEAQISEILENPENTVEEDLPMAVTTSKTETITKSEISDKAKISAINDVEIYKTQISDSIDKQTKEAENSVNIKEVKETSLLVSKSEEKNLPKLPQTSKKTLSPSPTRRVLKYKGKQGITQEAAEEPAVVGALEPQTTNELNDVHNTRKSLRSKAIEKEEVTKSAAAELSPTAGFSHMHGTRKAIKQKIIETSAASTPTPPIHATRKATKNMIGDEEQNRNTPTTASVRKTTTAISLATDRVVENPSSGNKAKQASKSSVANTSVSRTELITTPVITRRSLQLQAAKTSPKLTKKAGKRRHTRPFNTRSRRSIMRRKSLSFRNFKEWQQKQKNNEAQIKKMPQIETNLATEQTTHSEKQIEASDNILTASIDIEKAAHMEVDTESTKNSATVNDANSASALGENSSIDNKFEAPSTQEREETVDNKSSLETVEADTTQNKTKTTQIAAQSSSNKSKRKIVSTSTKKATETESGSSELKSQNNKNQSATTSSTIMPAEVRTRSINASLHSSPYDSETCDDSSNPTTSPTKANKKAIKKKSELEALMESMPSYLETALFSAKRKRRAGDLNSSTSPTRQRPKHAASTDVNSSANNRSQKSVVNESADKKAQQSVVSTSAKTSEQYFKAPNAPSTRLTATPTNLTADSVRNPFVGIASAMNVQKPRVQKMLPNINKSFPLKVLNISPAVTNPFANVTASVSATEKVSTVENTMAADLPLAPIPATAQPPRKRYNCRHLRVRINRAIFRKYHRLMVASKEAKSLQAQLKNTEKLLMPKSDKTAKIFVKSNEHLMSRSEEKIKLTFQEHNDRIQSNPINQTLSHIPAAATSEVMNSLSHGKKSLSAAFAAALEDHNTFPSSNVDRIRSGGLAIFPSERHPQADENEAFEDPSLASTQDGTTEPNIAMSEPLHHDDSFLLTPLKTAASTTATAARQQQHQQQQQQAQKRSARLQQQQLQAQVAPAAAGTQQVTTKAASVLTNQQQQHHHSIFTPFEPKKEIEDDPPINTSTVSNIMPTVQPVSGSNLLNGSLPAAVVDNSGTRLYSFLHPAKYNRSHGAVLLDYCCPNLDGPMPAIDPTRDHAQLQSLVRELPACIVMTTKVVTRADLEAKNTSIPASIRKKMEKLTTPATAATPAAATTRTPVLQALITAKGPPTLTPMHPTSESTTTQLPSALHYTSNISALQKQLPSNTTLTPKLLPPMTMSDSLPKLTPFSAMTTSSGAAMPATYSAAAGAAGANSARAAQPPVMTPRPDLMRAILRSNLRRFDTLLQKYCPRISQLNFVDRQRIMDTMLSQTTFSAHDVEQAALVLDDYCQLINSLPLIKITNTITTTSTVNTPTPTTAPMINVGQGATAPSSAKHVVAAQQLEQLQANTLQKVRITNAPATARQVPIYDKDRNVIGYQMQHVNSSVPKHSAITTRIGSITTATQQNIKRLLPPNQTLNSTPTTALKQPAQESPRIFYTKPMQTSTPIADTSNANNSSQNSSVNLTASSAAALDAATRLNRSVTIRQAPGVKTMQLNNSASRLLSTMASKLPGSSTSRVSQVTSTTTVPPTNIGTATTSSTASRITRHNASTNSTDEQIVIITRDRDGTLGSATMNNNSESILPHEENEAGALKEIKREREEGGFIGA